MIQAVVFFLIFIIFINFLISLFVTKKLMYPKVRDEITVFDRELHLNRFPVEFYDTLEKEEVTLNSNYGYHLSCLVLNNELTKRKENYKKIAIFCHGFKCSKTAAVVYAKILMDLGFTAVLYDHRNHGRSGKKFTSMGYYEKLDLKKVIDWCYQKYGKDIRIVLHGESMGATTVLNYLVIDDRMAAVIADCGYSDLSNLLKHQMRKYYHLPYHIFKPMINMILKLRAGFGLKDVSAMAGVIHSDTPTLFIHGDADDYVPYQMSIEMYQKKKRAKELYLAKNAIHAQACVVDLEQYIKVINSFIAKYYS